MTKNLPDHPTELPPDSDVLAALRTEALRGNFRGLEASVRLLSAALCASGVWLVDGDQVVLGNNSPPLPVGPQSVPSEVSPIPPTLYLAVLHQPQAYLVLVREQSWTDTEHRLANAAMDWISIAFRLSIAKRREEESDARYQALLNAGFEGLCLHKNGVMIEVNQALADLYGYTRDEMIGMNVQQLAAPEWVAKIGDIIQRGDGARYETAAIRKDQTIIPLEARGKNAVFRGEKVRVAAFRDLRERRRVEEALVHARHAAERASASKTEFLGNMSHELRTPMQGVLGLAHLVLQTDLSEEQRDFVDTLEQSASTLLTLLNDLLDITRIEERRLDIKSEVFSLSSIVAEAAQVVRAGIQAKGVALDVQLAAGLGDFYEGDPTRIRQVLINLLGNASKFTHDGAISLSVLPNRSHVVFRVTDSGIGMSEAQLTQVFTRFSQADSSISRKYGGSGLGLTISRGLIRAMDGHMSAESRPGEGSSFEFRLALSQVSAPILVQDVEAQNADLRSLNILVAEDNKVNQLVIRKLLEAMGHQVTMVENGQRCVDAWAAQVPDLVLMDMQMPVMDGLEAARTLRDLGCRVPIYALTANAMAGDRARCLAAGMSDYLTKPVQIPRLKALLVANFAGS